jgi:hypothetical protein
MKEALWAIKLLLRSILKRLKKMSQQLDQLTSAVQANTDATARLASAISNLPPATPPDDLTPAIAALNANTAAIAAAADQLAALAKPTV